MAIIFAVPAQLALAPAPARKAEAGKGQDSRRRKRIDSIAIAEARTAKAGFAQLAAGVGGGLNAKRADRRRPVWIGCGGGRQESPGRD